MIKIGFWPFRRRTNPESVPEPAPLRLDVHEQRAGALVDACITEYGHNMYAVDSLKALLSGRALLASSEETLVSAVVVAAARSANIDFYRSPGAFLMTALSRKKLPYAVEDIRSLLVLAAGVRCRWFPPQISPTVTIVQGWCRENGVDAVRAELQSLLAAVLKCNTTGYDHEPTKVGGRLRVLLDSARPDPSTFDDSEDFGVRAQKLVARLEPKGLAPLLAHLGTAASSKPSGAWGKRALELTNAAADGEGLLRGLLQQASEAGVGYYSYGRTRVPSYDFQDVNATVIRGSLWAAAFLKRPWAVPLMVAILHRGPFLNPSKVLNACVFGLGEIASPESLSALSQLRARVKDRGLLKVIDRALEDAAGHAGMSRSELRETLAPALGLDEQSSSTRSIGEACARVEVVAPGRVKTTWTREGQVLRGVPESVKENHADELRALQEEVRKLRQAVGNERRRMEDMFSEERVWRFATWQERYLAHPLLRPLTLNLVWTFDGLPALVTAEGFTTVDGSGLEPAEDAAVRLWHPIAAVAAEVAAWRSFLLERELMQPFKQAYREVYLLAPAEEATETYSNRFAAHILHYPQTYALLKERGWGGNALGPWDGGFEAAVFRDFPSHDIRAQFFLEYAESDGGGTVAGLASTDQVKFRPIRGRQDLTLAAVPPIVFSEAMRDVDLFVGVTSIAADPGWADRGADRFVDYWRATAFGELTASAEVRRDLLAELLPRLKIADRCRLEERFLVVEGRLRTYHIHLGSGNIQMEPNNQYLCIVPGARDRSQVRLPFEGDDRLTVILSKAFLLAADDKITDKTILLQIKR
jgi:hypothetical protein